MPNITGPQSLPSFAWKEGGIGAVLGIVSYRVFPVQMGGQKCVDGLYRHLAKKVRVTLAAAKENEVPADNSYEVLPFLFNHWRGILNIIYLYKLKKLIKEKHIDLLVIENSYFGWLGLLLRRITKKPVVIHSHNIEAHRFRDLQRSWWRIYEWYEKWVHRHVDHSFFITQEDSDWAILHWQLHVEKCSVLTYGTDILLPAIQKEKKEYRESLLKEYNLDAGTRLFFFNGTLDYLPNTDALRIIISELIPLLVTAGFQFRIFVSGRGLHKQWKQVFKNYPVIIYTGFIKDIDVLCKGTDCFINPVTLGSGIRTKLVEALALNQDAISTKTGAKGIPGKITGNKLVLVDDYDWNSFAAAMMKTDPAALGDTPGIFYTEFNWDNIIQKALLSLQSHA